MSSCLMSSAGISGGSPSPPPGAQAVELQSRVTQQLLTIDVQAAQITRLDNQVSDLQGSLREHEQRRADYLNLIMELQGELDQRAVRVQEFDARHNE